MMKTENEKKMKKIAKNQKNSKILGYNISEREQQINPIYKQKP